MIRCSKSFVSECTGQASRSVVLRLLIFLSLSVGCDTPDSDEVSQPPARQNETTDPDVAPGQNAPAPIYPDARRPFPNSRKLGSLPVRDDDWFDEIAAASGIDFHYRDASEDGFYQILESVGGGVACLDVELDGDPDLYFTGGGWLRRKGSELLAEGRTGALFVQTDLHTFNQSTTAAGLDSANSFTHGVTTGDLNCDGFPDLVVCGFRGISIYLNQGDGTFHHSTDLGIRAPVWCTTAVICDYDRDSYPDVYVLTYTKWNPDHTRRCLNDQEMRDVCGPSRFDGEQDILFHYNGSGTFDNVTIGSGLVDSNKGLGIVAADFDANGFIDFAVANDVEVNQLYMNHGSLPFIEDGLLSGVAYSGSGQRDGSMGIDTADFDGNGQLDIWITNYTQQPNCLLKRISQTGFTHVESLFGLSAVSLPWVGFGTGFADFDGDGWQDIYVINGHVAYEQRDGPYFQSPHLFRNDSGNRFVNISETGGTYFREERSGRGSAVVDLDSDGGPDIVVSHQNDPITLLHNRIQPAAWITIRLVGTTTARDGIGSVVEVDTGAGVLRKWRTAGGSYLSASDDRLLFALPEAGQMEVPVTVTWIDNTREVFDNLATGRCHTLVQGRGRRED